MKEINSGGLDNVYVNYAQMYYGWENQEYQHKGTGERPPKSVDAVVQSLRDDFDEDVDTMGQPSLEFPEDRIKEEVQIAHKRVKDRIGQTIRDGLQQAKAKALRERGVPDTAKERERLEKRLQKGTKRVAKRRALMAGMWPPEAPEPPTASRPPPKKAPTKLTREQKLTALKAEGEALQQQLGLRSTTASPEEKTRIEARLLEIIRAQRTLAAAKPTAPRG